MEVVRKTPLSQVRQLKEQIIQRDKQIVELSETKELLEEQILALMDVSANQFEENIILREQNIQVMEAIAELYETILGGNAL